ncbi:MAG: 4-alpha-glucanotransferase [Clostridia bacterium]|nr:4-alpha-glucanotransferase [Clostridia bacterium]
MIKVRKKRKAGVLMPVTALPSDCGIGTLGAGAYEFVDWLKSADMQLWQVLPLLPTSYGDSPYQSYAECGLNYYLIDFALLVKEGLLKEEEYQNEAWSTDERRVDYGKQFEKKAEVLKKAFARFDRTKKEWQAFLAKGEYYDFALFKALKKHFGDRAWTEWEEPYKNADEKTLERFAAEHGEELAFWQFTQYLTLRQWRALKAYANGKGIRIMGDMPIYVACDSVETWLHRRELFLVDETGDPALQAGVPPDAFCDDGQLWGNPVYDWALLEKTGYRWWKERIGKAFELFDVIRIDHFRGFDRFFAVEKGAETAKDGEWLPGPGAALFKDFKDYPIVAEDLGVIDNGVRKMMKKTGYPGMKVFSFAFDGNETNEHLPSQYKKNCVAYTGTHDNEPVRAMIEGMLGEERKSFEIALERECLAADTPYITETIEDEVESVVELLFSTKAETVIVPMHDVLAFGAEARINAPATVTGGNWTFRYTEKDFKRRKAAWLKELVKKYKR